MQVNANNSQAMSALTFLLFRLNTLHKETLINRQSLSEQRPWCNDSGVLNLHHGYYSTIMTSGRLFRHNPESRGIKKPIRKFCLLNIDTKAASRESIVYKLLGKVKSAPNRN